MADVFLSYARPDRLVVEPLARQLIFDGWTVWWDPDIVPGAEWADMIRSELAASRLVVVVWSERSVRSHWVRAEAEVGRQGDKIISVMIDGIEPPLGFGHLQHVDLSQWRFERDSHGYQALYAALRMKLGAPMGNVEESLEVVQAKFTALAKELAAANEAMLRIRTLNQRRASGDTAVAAELNQEIMALKSRLGSQSPAFHHVNDMARALGAFLTRRLVATGTSVLSGYLSTMRGLDSLAVELEDKGEPPAPSG